MLRVQRHGLLEQFDGGGQVGGLFCSGGLFQQGEQLWQHCHALAQCGGLWIARLYGLGHIQGAIGQLQVAVFQGLGGPCQLSFQLRRDALLQRFQLCQALLVAGFGLHVFPGAVQLVARRGHRSHRGEALVGPQLHAAFFQGELQVQQVGQYVLGLLAQFRQLGVRPGRNIGFSGRSLVGLAGAGTILFGTGSLYSSGAIDRPGAVNPLGQPENDQQGQQQQAAQGRQYPGSHALAALLDRRRGLQGLRLRHLERGGL